MLNLASKLPTVGTTIFTVMSRRARELGAINLSQGFPDFAPPEMLLTCLQEAATQDVHQYAPMPGVDALREQAALLVAQLNCPVPVLDCITITPGATEALFSSIHAVVHAGDEVIVFDPCYDSYVPSIELCGARAVRLPLRAPSSQNGSWSVDWQRVRDAINPCTAMIVLNTPHNPTGSIWSGQDMDTLAELTRDTRIVVLGDEVYAHMVFDGHVHHSLQGHAELRERSISVFSFGKLLHATGWRIGCTIAPPNLTAEFRKVHQFNTFATTNVLQWAIAEFLRRCPDHAVSLAAFYQRKRDLFLSVLAGSRFKWQPTPATFFQLLDYSAVADVDDVAMTERLLVQHGVASIPLAPFCENAPAHRYLRFCFAKRDETLEAAGSRLCSL